MDFLKQIKKITVIVVLTLAFWASRCVLHLYTVHQYSVKHRPSKLLSF
jgi:hypothetical protein